MASFGFGFGGRGGFKGEERRAVNDGVTIFHVRGRGLVYVISLRCLLWAGCADVRCLEQTNKEIWNQFSRASVTPSISEAGG
jgi:hypothetical protein